MERIKFPITSCETRKMERIFVITLLCQAISSYGCRFLTEGVVQHPFGMSPYPSVVLYSVNYLWMTCDSIHKNYWQSNFEKFKFVGQLQQKVRYLRTQCVHMNFQMRLFSKLGFSLGTHHFLITMQ